jgi:lipoprotein-anchoring transpeptidase ErfK/SrfK
VIYSTEHHVREPHKVGGSETLMDVASRYSVPWQLLKNINGISDPEVLDPGTELKIVSGPFRAHVNLAKGELTLFAGRLYAGRFPISVGQDPTPAPGDYLVRDKQIERTYYARDGRTIPGEHPENPYGNVWIDLGGEMCIHGSPPSTSRSNERLGCISLSPIDAADVFGILSQGSKVKIIR